VVDFLIVDAVLEVVIPQRKPDNWVYGGGWTNWASIRTAWARGPCESGAVACYADAPRNTVDSSSFF
jgi:hypothetical protein